MAGRIDNVKDFAHMIFVSSNDANQGPRYEVPFNWHVLYFIKLILIHNSWEYSLSFAIDCHPVGAGPRARPTVGNTIVRSISACDGLSNSFEISTPLSVRYGGRPRGAAPTSQ